MRRAGSIAVFFWFMFSGLSHAEDGRIRAELAETGEPIPPLQRVLGEERFQEALSSGRYHYVGNAKCRLCHRDFFLGRKEDVHEQALRHLVADGHEQEGRCLNCHSTGYGVPSGFVSLNETPRLANVQCEGCHGPGSEHMRRNARGGFLAGTDQPEVLKQMCLACHNERWDRAFDDFQASYDSYKTAVPGEEAKAP